MPKDDLRATLAAMKERANAATGGPWKIDPHDDGPLASIVSTADDRPWGWVETAKSIGDDAEFIAAARTEHPALVDALTAVMDVLDAEMQQAEQHLRISRTNHSLGERMLGQHTGASRVIGSVRRAITEKLGGL